ncbi:unnamed protein product, partial [Symbiodinium pilosum]
FSILHRTVSCLAMQIDLCTTWLLAAVLFVGALRNEEEQHMRLELSAAAADPTA